MKTLILFTALFIFSLSASAVECVVSGGCEQLCVEKDKASPISTMEWSDGYGCYKLFGTCEVQKDGKCGWTDKGSLQQCIKNPEEFKPQMNAETPAIPDKIAPTIKTP